ncbi:AAA family ATPase [Novosphingobium rosa]|uniref:AAA family ATPase n=1 Tax=Novosphingobium rosa TaxID=76978 RepID=UPI000829A45F|nr:AAA family ATPase [Novosphingobium rosa]
MFDDFYGFTARPFQLTPDPAFYFESATHRKALSYLGYGLAQGEGFVVITGDVGTGKSTLVAHLMATIDRQRLTAAQVVTSRLDDTDLVQLVAQAFAIRAEGEAALGRDPGTGKAKALSQIEAFLHAEARNGRRCLLVVDESQNLSDEALEELRMLSNFQLGNHPLLQILLLGQPEFRDHLSAHAGLEQLRQRVIAAHHLEPMGVDEVEAYLGHRLRLVGWQGRPTFAPSLFGEIHQASGGVPRRINQIVSRLLMAGGAEQRDQLDGVLLARVLSEMVADGGLSLGRVIAEPAHEAPAVLTARAAGGQKPVEEHHASLSEELGARLAEQAAQIAELQHAVIELASGQGVERPEDAAQAAASAAQAAAIETLTARLGELEARLAEQDRTLRHTLTMLIEWIERDGTPRVAA